MASVDRANDGSAAPRQSKDPGMEAVASAIEDVAGRLSIATRPDDVEKAVNDLLTIAANARSGVLSWSR